MAILCPLTLLVLACESREALGENNCTQLVLSTALPALKMTMRMNSPLNYLTTGNPQSHGISLQLIPYAKVFLICRFKSFYSSFKLISVAFSVFCTEVMASLQNHS